jgi:hypothetical protein
MRAVIPALLRRCLTQACPFATVKTPAPAPPLKQPIPFPAPARPGGSFFAKVQTLPFLEGRRTQRLFDAWVVELALLTLAQRALLSLAPAWYRRWRTTLVVSQRLQRGALVLTWVRAGACNVSTRQSPPPSGRWRLPRAVETAAGLGRHAVRRPGKCGDLPMQQTFAGARALPNRPHPLPQHLLMTVSGWKAFFQRSPALTQWPEMVLLQSMVLTALFWVSPHPAGLFQAAGLLRAAFCSAAAAHARASQARANQKLACLAPQALSPRVGECVGGRLPLPLCLLRPPNAPSPSPCPPGAAPSRPPKTMQNAWFPMRQQRASLAISAAVCIAGVCCARTMACAMGSDPLYASAAARFCSGLQVLKRAAMAAAGGVGAAVGGGAPVCTAAPVEVFIVFSNALGFLLPVG